jgi:hypothetical protein
MNPSLPFPRNLLSPRLGDLLPFVPIIGRRAGRAENREIDADGLLRTLLQAHDGLMQGIIEKRTAEEFRKAREESLPEFSKIISTLAYVAHILKPRLAFGAIAYEALSSLENDFKNEGRDRFGATANDQAIYTVWTLRRIDRLFGEILESGPVSEDLKERDRELAGEFISYSVWSHFHLDCLVTAMRFDRVLQPSVLSEVCDGLRAIVNAYGVVREGLEIRAPRPVDPDLIPEIEPTEEERELLASSMKDMAFQVLE